MMENRIGRQSVLFRDMPVITAWASVAGKKESQGPLAHAYDVVSKDSLFGAKTWEQAECNMQKIVLETLLKKAKITKNEIGLVCSGDLLNQCIGSSQALRNSNIPHIGLYGACSTMAEALLTAGMSVSGKFTDRAIATTSSHFASSERQYRFPLNYGGQRTPTAQWTVTGAGAALICREGIGPKLECGTIGSVVDLGIKDAANMGAAMAPAAFTTIHTHMREFGRRPEDYDLIVTGDLGQLGKELLMNLSAQNGLYLGGKLMDCGTEVFDILKQDVHQGGSGCGCSAITLCAHLLNKLQTGKLKRILFCGTGALLSTTSSQQGLSIPGVCHAVSIVGGE